jgi:putative glutathione S-transferase
MFNSEFDALAINDQDLWPKAMRNDIEEVNERIYHTFNNGVYKSGFATSQNAYDESVTKLFDTMDWLEDRLSTNRYLMGDALTEADWRLFTTLVRFDLVYHLHFKCNRSRVIDMPNLWAYSRELYQIKGIAKTCNFDHIVRHYYYSHETINPHRIVPINPAIDWLEPHGRGD